MNRPELYEQSVNCILDAFNKNELIFRRGGYCAVAAILRPASEATKISKQSFTRLFFTSIDTKNDLPIQICESYLYSKEQQEESKKLIDASGYTVEELKSIEYAFESYGLLNHHSKNPYDAMEIVINQLNIIHNTPPKKAKIDNLKMRRSLKKMSAAGFVFGFLLVKLF